jgi:hypothetical protein
MNCRDGAAVLVLPFGWKHSTAAKQQIIIESLYQISARLLRLPDKAITFIMPDESKEATAPEEREGPWTVIRNDGYIQQIQFSFGTEQMWGAGNRESFCGNQAISWWSYKRVEKVADIGTSRCLRLFSNYLPHKTSSGYVRDAKVSVIGYRK